MYRNPSSRLLCLASVFALCLSVGCENSQRRGAVVDADLGPPDSGVPNYSTYRYHYPATPPVLDADELKRLVDRHRNQVVVLAFWASWSGDSRAEIEKLAELTEQHREKGLRVIACTFDEPEVWGSKVVPMLQAAGANYPCVVLPSGARPGMRDWLGSQWSNDVPARFVVDRLGRTITRSNSEQTVLAALGTWGTPHEPTQPRYARASTRRATPSYRAPETTVATRTTSRSGDTLYLDSSSASRSSDTRYIDSPTAARRGDTYTRRTTTRTERSSVTTVAGRDNTAAVTVQAKLINVATGASESLPVGACGLEDPDCLAATVSAGAGARMKQRRNPRIAVLPFERVNDPGDPLGLETALRVRDGLRSAGFYDLISPKRAESLFEDAGLSPMRVDFDPGTIRGKVRADFVIIGWIRGSAGETRYFAGDGIGGDDTFSTPSRDAAIYDEY